jgi:hypothetical protein
MIEARLVEALAEEMNLDSLDSKSVDSNSPNPSLAPAPSPIPPRRRRRK